MGKAKNAKKEMIMRENRRKRQMKYQEKSKEGNKNQIKQQEERDGILVEDNKKTRKKS